MARRKTRVSKRGRRTMNRSRVSRKGRGSRTQRRTVRQPRRSRKTRKRKRSIQDGGPKHEPKPNAETGEFGGLAAKQIISDMPKGLFLVYGATNTGKKRWFQDIYELYVAAKDTADNVEYYSIHMTWKDIKDLSKMLRNISSDNGWGGVPPSLGKYYRNPTPPGLNLTTIDAYFTNLNSWMKQLASGEQISPESWLNNQYGDLQILSNQAGMTSLNIVLDQEAKAKALVNPNTPVESL